MASVRCVSGLSAPSGYFEPPKTLDDFKKTLDHAHGYGLHYLVVGDNPVLTADEWKKRAELYNECGKASLAAGIQYCYHAHFHEFADLNGTCGYDILLTRCDPKLLKMEMDIFWVEYAGKDPLPYWKRYPGRFPLLHIKDLRKGVTMAPFAFSVSGIGDKPEAMTLSGAMSAKAATAGPAISKPRRAAPG